MLYYNGTVNCTKTVGIKVHIVSH